MSCNFGYSMKDNVCRLELCKIDFCVSCNSPNKCSQCESGFEVANGECSVC